MNKIRVELRGIATASDHCATVLKESGGKRCLAIWIGLPEAQSILIAVQRIKLPRPLTHDLLKTVLLLTKESPKELVITELKDNTYYAVLETQSHRIDCRPSDGIALAVRCGIPIYAEEALLDTGAEFAASEESSNESHASARGESPTILPFLDKLAELQSELDEAVKKENYERAAELRDAINKLKPES